MRKFASSLVHALSNNFYRQLGPLRRRFSVGRCDPSASIVHEVRSFLGLPNPVPTCRNLLSLVGLRGPCRFAWHRAGVCCGASRTSCGPAIARAPKILHPIITLSPPSPPPQDHPTFPRTGAADWSAGSVRCSRGGFGPERAAEVCLIAGDRGGQLCRAAYAVRSRTLNARGGRLAGTPRLLAAVAVA